MKTIRLLAFPIFLILGMIAGSQLGVHGWEITGTFVFLTCLYAGVKVSEWARKEVRHSRSRSEPPPLPYVP